MRGERLTGSITVFGATEGWDVAVVVPAKDEADRIIGCLAAITASASRVGGYRVGLVLVVNNTVDDTAARACTWAAQDRGNVSVMIVDHHFPGGRAGVGRARGLGLDLAVEAMPGNGVLLMTDADTLVSPTWIDDNLAELHWADVICGRVGVIADEEAALPAEINSHGNWEADYSAAALQLATLLDPLPHDPRPAHHNGPGATMAFRKSVYLSVGGMPTIEISEDRAFVALAEAQDYRIRYSHRPTVRTSCRMIGRTEGGMAGALRDRCDLPDPLCDEWLEPAETFHLRYALRGALRKVWPVPDAVNDVLFRWLGTEAATLRDMPLPLFFGQFIQQIEARAPSLTRLRMRQSDCRRELPDLQRLLAERLASPRAVALRAPARPIGAVSVGV